MGLECSSPCGAVATERAAPGPAVCQGLWGFVIEEMVPVAIHVRGL